MNNMLITPLGEIEINIDNIPVDYTYIELPKEPSFCDLSGRYFVKIEFSPDGENHTITCKIKNLPDDTKGYIESGENLECKSFYYKTYKMSIGMEGDTGYFSDGTRVNGYYDYDTAYLDDGVEYMILQNTKTDTYVFGIAWIEDYNEDNDVQTWLGADPTLLK